MLERRPRPEAGNGKQSRRPKAPNRRSRRRQRRLVLARVKPWLFRLGLAAAALALGVSLDGGWLKQALQRWLPDQPAFTCAIKEWAEDTLGTPAPDDGGDTVVLLARFAGDADGAVHRALTARLRDQPGLRLRQACRGFELGDGVQVAADPAARQAAEALLQARKADLLIWGDAGQAGLKIRFGGQDSLRRRDASTFFVDRGLLAPAQARPFADALTVAALAAAAGTETRSGRAAAAALGQRLPALEAVLADPPAALSAAQRAELRWARARGVQAMAAQAEEAATLEQAVEYWRELLVDLDPLLAAQAWAEAQTQLGITLARAGEREGNPVRFEAAIGAYNAALQVWPRQDAPLAWALTQNNLGNALVNLGERSRDPARLEAGIAAYRAALETLSRDQAPLDWAMTQNNLANALATQGDQEGDLAKLEAAAEAYSGALQGWTRERMPLGWAATQHNLGATLRALGARSGNAARLEAAAAAYRAALEEWTRDRTPMLWAQTLEGLALTAETLAALGAGPARLQEALADAEAAVEEYRRSGAEIALARGEALVSRLRSKAPG